MEKIKATKNGFTREFTLETWNRLGADKGGWKAIPKEVQNIKTNIKAEKVINVNPEKVEEKKVSQELSVDVNTVEAIAKIKELNSKDEISAYIQGEKRKTVIGAVKKRLSELNQ